LTCIATIFGSSAEYVGKYVLETVCVQRREVVKQVE
jgi:hypothetical protein